VRHDEFKKVIHAIDIFTEERNSPSKAQSLVDLVNICRSYIESTTHGLNTKGIVIEQAQGVEPDNLEQTKDD